MSFSYLMLLIYEVTFLDPYSAATLFGGVTDWYLEPSRHWVSDDELEAPEEAPPSPDYMPGPKHPSSLDYMPALSPGYVADSDPEEDPKKDHEEDPADYPADGGDDDDDESSEDDVDDEDEEASKEEDDDEEEVEHLAPVDSSVVPAIDPIPSAEDTEVFETDESAPTPPSPRPRRTRIYVRLQTHIPSPPLPVPSLLLPLPSPPTHTSPSYADAPLGYRAVGIRLRAASPPLLLPSTTHEDDIPEVDIPLQKRARFTAPASGFKVRETSATAAARQPGLDIATVDATPRRPMSREVGYGIKDVWYDMVGDMEERAPTTIEGLSQRVTDLSTTLARDTYEIYVRLEDAQDD
ncbi:hypothetical protein Tco_0252976 [Tanacetum coccineum]